jgi:hypothetical protein
VHVGNDNTHFIALHWSNFVDNVNTRGLYDYDGGWVCGFNGTNTYLLGGNVGVGLRAPTVKLHVDGGVLATKVYLYKPNAANDTGAVYLEYDSTKLGIHLVGAGIYTDTYVSALGVGSGGSGSSGTLHNLDDVDIDDSTLHNGQILVYRNTHWVNEDMPTPGGGGTVTSISAGTGLSSSTGGAITTTGTISISSTYQTYISHGETAYGWGDHATAGYLTGINASMINTALGFTLSGTAGETYNLDAFLTSVAFTDLSSTPTTLSGYGITDAVGNSTTWWGAQISNGAVFGPMTSVGNITLNNNSRISTGGGSTELYIGNSDNGGWVKLQDVCSASGYGNWAIYTDGRANLGDLTMNYEGIDGARFIYFGGNSFYIKKMNNRFVLSTNGTETINVYDDRFYCTTKIHTVVGLESEGYVTALSDIRHKDVCGTPKLTVEDIAQTQPILFTWKDKQKDQSVQAGAIAQEWQKILPEVVRENDGVLSMDYGVAALVSAMTIAKTVVNHEQRLTRLENELNKQKEL